MVEFWRDKIEGFKGRRRVPTLLMLRQLKRPRLRLRGCWKKWRRQ
jgi:hypothetical protein